MMKMMGDFKNRNKQILSEKLLIFRSRALILK